MDKLYAIDLLIHYFGYPDKCNDPDCSDELQSRRLDLYSWLIAAKRLGYSNKIYNQVLLVCMFWHMTLNIPMEKILQKHLMAFLYECSIDNLSPNKFFNWSKTKDVPSECHTSAEVHNWFKEIAEDSNISILKAIENSMNSEITLGLSKEFGDVESVHKHIYRKNKTYSKIEKEAQKLLQECQQDKSGQKN